MNTKYTPTQDEKDQALKDAQLRRDAELEVKANEVSSGQGILAIIQLGAILYMGYLAIKLFMM